MPLNSLPDLYHTVGAHTKQRTVQLIRKILRKKNTNTHKVNNRIHKKMSLYERRQTCRKKKHERHDKNVLRCSAIGRNCIAMYTYCTTYRVIRTLLYYLLYDNDCTTTVQLYDACSTLCTTSVVH